MKHFLRAFFVLALLFGAGRVTAQCFPGWYYLNPVTVTNSTPAVLSAFQVKVTLNTATLVGAAQMNSNGDDIRFSDLSCNNLPYYIESGMNSANTVIWVKVNNIPASGSVTINMYYGNPAAPAVSNGDSVFEFWDDFNDNNFNTAKWEPRGTMTSGPTESGGVMTFSGQSNWSYVRSRVNFSGPVVVEDQFRMTGVSGGFVLGYPSTDNRFTFRDNGGNCGTTQDYQVVSSNSWFNTGYPAVPYPSVTAPNFQNFRYVPQISANYIQVLSFCNLTTVNCNNTATLLNAYSGSQFFIGYSSWDASSYPTVDWVHVRKYNSTDPTVVVGAQQSNFLVDPISTSDSTMCPGAGFNANVTVAGTFNPGNNYIVQLSDATGSFAAPVSIGTLASSATGSVVIPCTLPANTPAGSAYRIRIKATNPSLTGNANAFNITVFPIPLIQLGPDTTVCGSSYLLDAGNPGGTYVWSNGGSNMQNPVSTSGQHSVIVTSADGCIGYDTVNVTLNPNPVVNLGPDTTGCADNTVLDAGNPGASYTWSSGGNAQTLAVTQSGLYWVDVRDANGCMGRDSVQITIAPNPSVQISITGNVLDAGAGFSSWQWNWNGAPINGATQQTYTASQTGWYRVDVTNASGCSGSDSVYFYVFVSNDPGSDEAFRVWPQPAKEVLNVSLPSSGEAALIQIYDAIGKRMYSESSTSANLRIDLSTLPAGNYFLLVKAGERNYSARFIRED